MNETFLKKIEELADRGEFKQALSLLDNAIAENSGDDMLFMTRGKLYWRLGDRSRATSDYSMAIHINPESPACHLLEMARAVENFYNPDLLNP
ncbi:MAG: hypothetical protein K2O00_03535 [Muribaculaceae bacterium]|nr:hypothetical protein [Muribaculaceae bacterium]